MNSSDSIYSILLKGGLNGSSAQELQKYVEDLHRKGYQKILINFQNVDYITSYGISVLIKLHKEWNKPGYGYAFFGLQDEVLDVLSLVGLSGKLFCFPGQKEAERFLLVVNPKLADQNWEKLPEPESVPIGILVSGKTNMPVSTLKPLEESPSESPTTTPEKSSLEDKLNSIRLEIKESLEQELERRFSYPRVKEESSTNPQSTVLPNFIQTKTKSSETVERLFHCEVCGSHLRVKQLGKHKCPNCGSLFEMGFMGNLRFLEKLDPST